VISGAWEICPPPRVVTPTYCYIFLSALVALTSLITFEKSIYSKCYVLTFYAIWRLFFTSNSAVLLVRSQKFFPGAEYPNYITT